MFIIPIHGVYIPVKLYSQKTFIRLLGGRNFKSYVNEAWKKVITDVVGKDLNWKGVQKSNSRKIGIEKKKITKTILGIHSTVYLSQE